MDRPRRFDNTAIPGPDRTPARLGARIRPWPIDRHAVATEKTSALASPVGIHYQSRDDEGMPYNVSFPFAAILTAH